MAEYNCPLCKQEVTEKLFEKITGIWKQRKIAEKRFKEKERKLLAQKRKVQKYLESERKRMKVEQKEIIEEKIASKVKKYDTQIKNIQLAKDKLEKNFNKKVALAVKSAEVKVKRDLNKELKAKMADSLNREVKKVTLKTQQNLVRATRTIDATRKQMSTLQKQNSKQQQRIGNLERQLKKRTTPQLEGLLYEETLLAVLEKEFPKDKFKHTGKGGDIVQYILKNQSQSGVIVYECKRVSHWQTSHIEQAARAKLQRKADYSILVTNAVKKGTEGFFVARGVVVVPPGGVIALVCILREQLIKISELKLSSAQRERAIKKTFEYLQGPEFKNGLEEIIHKTKEMYEDLRKECKDHVKGWHKRYDSLKSVYTHSAKISITTSALVSGKNIEAQKELAVHPFPVLEDLTKVV